MVKIMLTLAAITAAVAVISSILFGKETEPEHDFFPRWFISTIKPQWFHVLNRLCWILTILFFFTAVLARGIAIKANILGVIFAALVLTLGWFLMTLIFGWGFYGLCQMIRKRQEIRQWFFKFFTGTIKKQ